jgi:hypothetical protein
MPGTKCAVSRIAGRTDEWLGAATAALDVQNKGGIYGRPAEFRTGGKAARTRRRHRLQMKE